MYIAENKMLTYSFWYSEVEILKGEKNTHKKKPLKCPLAVEKTPVINFGKPAVLGRVCGYFFCVLLAVWCCFKRALLEKGLLLGNVGWGWAQCSLGCSACHQAWRRRPACLDQVSRLVLVGSSFSSDLDALEFPLLKKWIILICILIKPQFSLKVFWSL